MTCLFAVLTVMIWLNSPVNVARNLTFGLLAFAFLIKPNGKYALIVILIWLVIVLAGEFHQSALLPTKLEGHTLRTTVTITDIMQQSKRRAVFIAKIHDNLSLHHLHGRVIISWYDRQRPVLTTGLVCHFSVKLKRPVAPFNHLGLDNEARWFTQGIIATGYVKGSLWRCDSGTTQNRQSIRERLSQQLDHLPGLQDVGLIKALTLGEKRQLHAEVRNLYQATGVAHVLVISGLHLSLVAQLCFWFFHALFKLLALRYQTIVAKRPAALLSICVVFLYAALAGFSIPSLRAFIMSSCFFLRIMGLWRLTIWQSILLAATLCVVLSPTSAMSLSYWLSFSAVITIAYLTYARQKTQSSLALCLPMTLMANVWSAYYFHTISLVAPLANLIVVPWTSYIVVPLCLLGLLLMLLQVETATMILQMGDRLLHYQNIFLLALIQLPIVQVHHSITHGLAFCCAIVAVLLICLPSGVPGRFIGVILGILAISASEKPIGHGDIRLRVFDVGQGLATMIETQHHRLIYDLGPCYGFKHNAVSEILLPFLSQWNLVSLDKLVISHWDSDHSCGIRQLLHRIDVKQLISSEHYAHHLTHLCQAGQRWQWDGVDFEFLHPDRMRYKKRNNRSCVLKVSNQKHQILLTGDIEQRAEKQLVAMQQQRLHADILIAPHHGSKTSSSLSFLKAVSPKLVVISAGYRNAFHFPHQIVSNRYRKMQANLYNTAKNGVLLFYVHDNDDVTVEKGRDAAYFWQTLIDD